MSSIDLMAPDWPPARRLRVVSTGRGGGYSSGAFSSLNLADHVGDDPVPVMANRQLLATHLGVERIHWLRQVHGRRVASAEECGSEADGFYCDRPGIACGVLTADCLPVVLAGDDGREFAVCHAGWRGLAGGILEAALDRFQAPPATLFAWLAPAIGPDHFEVGQDVLDAFSAIGLHDAPCTLFGPPFVAAGRPGKYLANLYALASLALARRGVTRVYGGGECTYCSAARFFSYRRDGTTGRMATVAMIEA